jgi:Family of unknown function (DUF6247)
MFWSVRHARHRLLPSIPGGVGDNQPMTAAPTKIKRSGPAIRAVLAEVSPAECAQFEVEFAQALARAGTELDLASAEVVLDRWWGIAVIRANPLSEQEQAQLARARAGDFTGLWERDAAGNWAHL